MITQPSSTHVEYAETATLGLPVVGLSWISQAPLLDWLLPRLEAPSLAALVRRIVGHHLAPVDAPAAAYWFRTLARNPAYTVEDKLKIFNTLPLALTANCPPGRPEIEASVREPAERIADLAVDYDEGRGEYRGWVSFTPWIQVSGGRIRAAGILGAETHRTAVEARLPHPLTSPGMTPLPLGKDYDDVLLGLMASIVTDGQLSDLRAFFQVAIPRTMERSQRIVMPDTPEQNVGEPELTTPTVVHVGATEAVFEFRHEGRVSGSAVTIGRLLNGRNIPWITLAIRVVLRADGTALITCGHSRFPAHAVYVVAEAGQDAAVLVAPTPQALHDHLVAQRSGVRVGHVSHRTVDDAVDFVRRGKAAAVLGPGKFEPSPPVFPLDHHGSPRTTMGNLSKISIEIKEFRRISST